MQGYLKQIQNFVTSPLCIFKLQTIDYPSKLQQHFIESYFNFIKILQKPHTQIIRQLNSQSSYLISSGFMYMLLLDEKNQQKLQQYVMVLRTETWNAMSQQFQRLLFEFGENIKECYRINLVHIFNLLFLYRMSNPSIINNLANLIAFYDNSRTGNQKFAHSLLVSLNQKIKQNNGFSSEQISYICDLFLPKIIKIAPYYDQELCGAFVNTIWNKYNEKCIKVHQQLIYIIQSSSIYLKIHFISAIYRTIKQNQHNIEQDNTLSGQICFSFLSRPIQRVLEFSFVQKLNHNQLKYQLAWLQKSWQNNNFNYIEALVDISRWTSLMSDFLEQRIVILQWVCRKSVSFSSENFQRVKRAIFYNWFLEKFNIGNAVTSLILLRHFLATDTRLSVQLLNYLFKWRSSSKSELRLSYIFQQANKIGYLKSQKVTQNSLVPAKVQQNYKQLFQSPPIDLSSALKFNPQSPNKSQQGQAPNYGQVQSAIQTQVDPRSNKNSSEELEMNSNIELSALTEYKNNEYQELFLEEEYANEFEMELLQNMLTSPSFETFVVFFKTFTKIGGQARTNNRELIGILVQDTAKIIFCAFNNQFEDISQIVQPQKSVIYYILAILLKEWHQVTHRIQLIKSLVKKICQLFPSAEVAFWYYFIIQFQYGGANNRDFKNWLIPKEKLSYVVQAVQALTGKSDQVFLRKALKYSIK